jgi:hypothetical protein
MYTAPDFPPDVGWQPLASGGWNVPLREHVVVFTLNRMRPRPPAPPAPPVANALCAPPAPPTAEIVADDATTMDGADR